jgi:DNA-binding IclR family transcriptional regulator
MKTYEKVIEALKDGPQSPSEISVNALVPAGQVSSALRTLQSKGMVGREEDNGRTIYHLTGVGL